MFSRFWQSITGRFAAGAKVSYSRINAYQTCPLKYKLMYLDGLRVPPNPFISLGISIHRTLEDYHRKGGERLEDLFESFDSFWVNEGFQTPQQTHEFYEKGRRMLENYHKDSTHRASEILHLEKEFSCRLGKNRLHGIIDRVDRHPDGTFELIDYKTHAELWKQSRVDSDLQLTLYALACKKVLGFKP
ncbi:MAG: RecB family exonuclease, partial [Endomicrobiales bacterium]